MSGHDAVSDDGVTVVCACSRVFEGARARDRHIAHQRVEAAREELRKAREGNDGE